MMKTFISTSLILLTLIISSPAEAGRNAVHDEDALTAMIQDYVAQQLAAGLEEIRVSRVVPSDGGSFPSSGKVKGLRAGSKGRLLGRVLFILSIEGQGRGPISRWVTAEVERMRTIVVASRPLKRHHVLRPDDLTTRTLSVTRQRNHYVSRSESLVGLRLTRSTGKGVPFRPDLVEDTPLIIRGERVILLLESGGLQIMTLGRAKEDGFLGKIIGIQNLDSKKVVYGKVVESGVVKVSFKTIR